MLVGGSRVGKTSIFKRYIYNDYQNASTTIGYEFMNKIEDVEGNDVVLRVWDQSGTERFRTTIKSIYFHRRTLKKNSIKFK